MGCISVNISDPLNRDPLRVCRRYRATKSIYPKMECLRLTRTGGDGGLEISYELFNIFKLATVQRIGEWISETVSPNLPW
jgi:hypothetical protein